MRHEQTCTAVCGGGSSVKGVIRCVSGRLFDVSHCVPKNFVSTNISKVIGELEIKVTGEPKVSFFIKALAAAFDINETSIEVFIKTNAETQGRRLRQGLLSRRLFANIIVHYEVTVPPNVSENTISSRASALSQANSSSALSLSASMMKSGVQVEEVAQTLAPLVVQSVTVMDQDGALVNDRNSPSADVPADDSKNSSINVGAIVGGVLGGIAILLVLVGVVYHVLLRRKAEC